MQKSMDSPVKTTCRQKTTPMSPNEIATHTLESHPEQPREIKHSPTIAGA